MRQAIALAWRGWGRVAPNPMVGCVLIRDGRVVGDGWHAEFGGVHAERMALERAGERARGATAVVTLEPCAHTGQQPPCADALVAAGVSRVIYAVADPNPMAAGGAERLRRAGVIVEEAPGDGEATRQLAGFLHRHRHPARPWVALKLATSLDGRLADRAGQSRWLTGQEARRWVHWLRAGFDAIAVGAGTARADDPRLTVRGPVTPRVAPRRVVFARDGDLSPDLRLFAAADGSRTGAVVVAAPGAAAASSGRGAGATVIEAETLAAGLAGLREAGIASLLIEGGGRLAGSLVEADLVDRLYLVAAPLLLGETGLPSLRGLDRPLDHASRWVPVERRTLGADTLTVLERTA